MNDAKDADQEDAGALVGASGLVAEPEDLEPLNSEDDEDSDEGGDTLFQCTDIVICQFEKVRLPSCRREVDDVSVFDGLTFEIFCLFGRWYQQTSNLQVTRTRNRWKFVFKDGLIEANGVNRVFHRATGEAEW